MLAIDSMEDGPKLTDEYKLRSDCARGTEPIEEGKTYYVSSRRFPPSLGIFLADPTIGI